MPGKHSKSGGKRAAEAKQRERDAKRPAGWAAKQRRAFVAITNGKRGAGLAVAILEHAARWSGRDPGMPPEYLRDQQVRAGQALSKAAEPERVIREQAELIAKLTAALQGKRDGDAVPVASGGPGAGQATSH